MSILKSMEAETAQVDSDASGMTFQEQSELREENARLKSDIDRLVDALWEKGSHTNQCPIHEGGMCTCGLFDLLGEFDLPEARAALGEAE